MLNALALETVIFRYSDSGEYYSEKITDSVDCQCDCGSYDYQEF